MSRGPCKVSKSCCSGHHEAYQARNPKAHKPWANFGQSNFHKKLGSEVLWVLLPISMLVAMAIPSTFNAIGLDGLSEFKKQAYAALSGDRNKKTPLKDTPKSL